MKIFHIGDMCHVGVNIHKGLLKKNACSSKILISSYASNYEKSEGILFNPFQRNSALKYLYTLLRVLVARDDIYHAHGMGAVFPFMFGKKYFLHMHGSDIRELQAQKDIMARVFRMLIRHAALNIVSTYDLKKHYLEQGFDAKKLVYIMNSIEMPKKVKHDFVKDGRIKLFCPASNHYTKGKTKLIEAFKILEEKYPNIELTLIEHPQGDAELKYLIRETGIKNIKFIPRVSPAEMGELYYEFDIVLDQFILDAYGVITLEAISRGIPTICSIGNENGDFTKDSPVLAGNSPEKIVQSVSYIIDNNLFETIGRQSREWALHNIAGDVVADRYYSLYKKVLHEN